MNLEDDKIEPVADLGLSLDDAVCCNQREGSNINDSAGANAGSNVHMAFVATDPLTELVWSPHKGLSLKYTECSFSDRKPALVWGAGPSNTAGRNCISKPLNEQSFIGLEKIVDAKFGFTPMNEPNDEEKIGDFENAIEMNLEAPAEVSPLQKTYDDGEPRDGQKAGTYGPVSLKMAETSECRNWPTIPGCEGETKVDVPTSQLLCSSPSSDQKLGLKMVVASELQPVDAYAPPLSPWKEKGKRKMTMSSTSLPHIEKLESSAENDLQAASMSNISQPGAKFTPSPKSAPAIQTGPLLDHEGDFGDNVISISRSLSSSSRAHNKHENKGKGKALSEGDVSGRFSKDEEEDDSYESVESCNSAGFFPTGKRRWSFEQQLIVGSKRVKQIEQTPGTSSSLKKHDSSFMNWISNMMKGFAKPLNDVEDAHNLRLALADSSHDGHENPHILMDGDIRPLSSRSIGFMSIFQSMYCPNKGAEGVSACYNHMEEGLAGAKQPNQVGPADANMPTCLDREKDNKFLKENSNENILENLIVSQDIVKDSSSWKMNSNGCVDGKSKDGTKTSELSLSGCNTKKTKINNSPPSEEKKANNLEYIGNLWITRFSARSPSPLFKQEVGNPCIGGACENVQGLVDSSHDQAAPEVRGSNHQEPPHITKDREVKSFGFSHESSVGFRRIEDPTLMQKVNRILPSPRLNSSEAMASVFARRLDALKNIIPSSDLIDVSSRANTTCFFCGIKGHHLQNCSEVTEPELEDILKNMNSYDNTEGSPRLCIRCFQLNHWAVACPNTSQKNNPKSNLKCNLKSKEVITGDAVVSSLNRVQEKSNENIIESSNLEKWLASEVPKGIFCAIKTLRLSRTDILKWMDSQISLSLLDGFFLRLRLGKWEEGLGGTGYYVACIAGMQRKSVVKSAESPISVNVGGFKCFVESRYISNHDFLEDELVAWWRTNSKGGGKIPSEEEMKTKAAEKKMLGF